MMSFAQAFAAIFFVSCVLLFKNNPPGPARARRELKYETATLRPARPRVSGYPPRRHVPRPRACRWHTSRARESLARPAPLGPARHPWVNDTVNPVARTPINVDIYLQWM